MTLSAENDMFLLFVNQIDFYNLPYKYDLTQEGDSNVQYLAKVEFDCKAISLPEPWSNQDFIKNFQETLVESNSEFTKASIQIEQSNSSGVVNELYDSMVEFSSIENGIESLFLRELPKASQIDLKFDPDILLRLVSKTQNLQNLQIQNTADISDSAKKEFLPTVL